MTIPPKCVPIFFVLLNRAISFVCIGYGNIHLFKVTFKIPMISSTSDLDMLDKLLVLYFSQFLFLKYLLSVFSRATPSLARTQLFCDRKDNVRLILSSFLTNLEDTKRAYVLFSTSCFTLTTNVEVIHTLSTR